MHQLQDFTEKKRYCIVETPTLGQDLNLSMSKVVDKNWFQRYANCILCSLKHPSPLSIKCYWESKCIQLSLSCMAELNLIISPPILKKNRVLSGKQVCLSNTQHN